jgi:hypothetical protein
VNAVGAEPSLEALAAAFARPMMRALALGGRELDVMRIVARAGNWLVLAPSGTELRILTIQSSA